MFCRYTPTNLRFAGGPVLPTGRAKRTKIQLGLNLFQTLKISDKLFIILPAISGLFMV